MVAEQIVSRRLVDKVLLLEIIHPVEVRREEDVGRRHLLDLLGERRGGGVADHDLVSSLCLIFLCHVVERVLETRGGKHGDVGRLRRSPDEWRSKETKSNGKP